MSDASALPSPIEPATVSLLLGYIALLDAPLPPHFISRELLKRHHFLSLGIDTPHEYLAWPSHDSQEAVTLLLGEASQLQNAHDLRLNVRYSADEEVLAVHVAPLASGGAPKFRLIFHHHPTDGWQYHNSALMPFPRDTYPTIADAYGALAAPHDFLTEPTYSVAVTGADDDDAAYWNSYGQDVDEDNDPSHKNTLKAHPDPNSEDAYWARYSSIHGSADSTIPSPLPVKRGADGVQRHGEDRIFVTIPNDPNDEPYNPLEPPSPDALARRLAGLAQRPASPPFEDEASSEDSDIAATPELAPEPAPPTKVVNDELSPSSPKDAAPGETQPISTRDSQQYVMVDESQASSPKAPEPAIDETDAALQTSIQGLHRLWKLTARQGATEEDFIALVRRAIGEP